MNMSKLVVRLRAVLCVAAFALVLFGCEQSIYEPEDGLSTDRRAAPGVGADYEIGDEADLLAFAKRVNSGEYDANGILVDNIALTQPWTPIGIAASGTAPVAYTGTFNGEGFAITGLNVKIDGNFAGLFAVNRGTIRDLTVAGTVSSTAVAGNYVGGIVGYNSYTGYIIGVTSNVTVTATGTTGTNGAWNVGGIAGFNGCDIYNTDSPDYGPTYYTGGTITQTINNGAVSGAEKVGGIAGENAGTISLSLNKGAITGNSGSSSRNGVGGIAGRNGNNNNPTEVGLISSCYNTGAVSVGSGKWLGGLTGFSNNTSTIVNSYDIGDIDPNKTSTGFYNPIVGGRDNYTDGQCKNNYSLSGLRHSSTATPESDYTVGIVKTEAQFKDPSFPASLGGNFKVDTKGINGGYPILNWQ